MIFCTVLVAFITSYTFERILPFFNIPFKKTRLKIVTLRSNLFLYADCKRIVETSTFRKLVTVVSRCDYAKRHSGTSAREERDPS